MFLRLFPIGAEVAKLFGDLPLSPCSRDTVGASIIKSHNVPEVARP